MRIAVCHPQTPFVRGGAENHSESLVAALREAGHDAEIVSAPFKWYPAAELVHQIGMWRSLDLSETNGMPIDMVIALKFPAYLVKHTNKVVWLIHQHRTAYELSKWLGETALLQRAAREEGPALCIARIGGLVGSSVSGATHRRNSLYLLADHFDDLPLGLLPVSRGGRVDMLHRDVAAGLLLEGLQALHAAPPDDPEILHVCAGESAPLTEVVLGALESVDIAHRRARPRTVRVPTAAVLAASEQLRRYRDVPRSWHNVLIGLRYLSLDRVFERSRLAALVPGPLPTIAIEELVRSAFELPAPEALPAADSLSLARFAG